MSWSFGRQTITFISLEILVRVGLLAAFFYTEWQQPFIRVIQPEEWWLYKNPHAAVTTVSTSKLFVVAVCSPIVTIVLFDVLEGKKNDFLPGILASSLALCLNGIITNAIKLSVGRPRPDFYFRCYPDGNPPDGQPSTYNLKCLGSPDAVIEGRKSFPSGHSSFAFVSLGFCAFYMAGKLQCFGPAGRGATWRMVVSLSPLLLATMVGVSRTCDYMHHWQDVVVGSLLGLSIAYLCYRQYYPALSAENPHQPHAMPRTMQGAKSVHDLFPTSSSSTSSPSSAPLLPTSSTVKLM